MDDARERSRTDVILVNQVFFWSWNLHWHVQILKLIKLIRNQNKNYVEEIAHYKLLLP